MYRELRPVRSVAGVIQCGWERYARAGTEVLVLPDGCVDIVWRSDGLLFVAGPDLRPVVHQHLADTAFVGVRLRPGTAGAVLGLSAHELRDQRVPIASLWGRAGESLADRLAAADSVTRRHQIFAAAIGDRIDRTTIDGRILAAAEALATGSAGVAEISARVGISGRHLGRLFVQQVGYGPKTFERVIRFRRFLTLIRQPAVPGRGLAEAAAAAGYADQSHLTRECRRLAARTPLQLLPTMEIAGPRG